MYEPIDIIAKNRTYIDMVPTAPRVYIDLIPKVTFRKWGYITGDVTHQTDLINFLNENYGSPNVGATLVPFGDIITGAITSVNAFRYNPAQKLFVIGDFLYAGKMSDTEYGIQAASSTLALYGTNSYSHIKLTALGGGTSEIVYTATNRHVFNTNLQVGGGTIYSNALDSNIKIIANVLGGVGYGIMNGNLSGWSANYIGSDNNNLLSFGYYNSGVAGNYAGTSVPIANSSFYQSGSGYDRFSIFAGKTHIFLTETTALNSALRLDANGFKITVGQDMHNACTFKFEVGGTSYFGGNVYIGVAGTTSLWNGDNWTNTRFVQGYYAGNLVYFPQQNLNMVIAGYDQLDRMVISNADHTVRFYSNSVQRLAIGTNAISMISDFFDAYATGNGDHGFLLREVGGVIQGRFQGNAATGEVSLGSMDFSTYFLNLYSGGHNIVNLTTGGQVNILNPTSRSANLLNVGGVNNTTGRNLNIYNNFNGSTGISLENNITGNVNNTVDIVFSNNTSNGFGQAYIGRNGYTSLSTSVNYAGTVISTDDTFFIQNVVGNVSTSSTVATILFKDSALINLPGYDSTNYGTRLDYNGLRIGKLVTLHTANLYPFEVVGLRFFENGIIYSSPFNQSFIQLYGNLAQIGSYATTTRYTQGLIKNTIETVEVQRYEVSLATFYTDVKFSGKINASALPTSPAGLSAGDCYNDSGIIKIV